MFCPKGVCWALDLSGPTRTLSHRDSAGGGRRGPRLRPVQGKSVFIASLSDNLLHPRDPFTFPRHPSIWRIILIFSPPSSTTKRNVPVCMPFGESPALFVCVRSTWHRYRVRVHRLLATVFIVRFITFSPVSFQTAPENF